MVSARRAARLPAVARRSRLLDVLAAALRAVPDWQPAEHLLVAISGGPDSTALLAGLTHLRHRFGHRVTAAHVAHALRGAESERDQAAAAALAARLGVPFEVLPAAIAPGANLEARARRARYRALAAAARRLGATRIVTGHTRDDQVETVLLRLLRGAGRGGLGGIAPQRRELLRPLLGATRVDVRWFLAEEDLPAVVDRSNADLAHTRNRVRRLLVPLLAGEFSPRIGERLAGLADRLRDEQAYLHAQAALRLAALSGDGGLAVGVAAEPPALARIVLSSWLSATATVVRSRDVERLLALAASGASGRRALPGGGAVVSDGRNLTYVAMLPAAGTPFVRSLTPGESVVGPGARWRLTLGPARDRTDAEPLPVTLHQALFDADTLPAPLLLRSPSPGDRIHLPGVGTRKLQDLLVDAKVPRADRWAVPVLLAADTVVWVGGLARSGAARLLPHTRRVIDARLEPV